MFTNGGYPVRGSPQISFARARVSGELGLCRPYTYYSPISTEVGMTPSLFIYLPGEGRHSPILPLEGPGKNRIITTTRVFSLTFFDASRAAELA